MFTFTLSFYQLFVVLIVLALVCLGRAGYCSIRAGADTVPYPVMSLVFTIAAVVMFAMSLFER